MEIKDNANYENSNNKSLAIIMLMIGEREKEAHMYKGMYNLRSAFPSWEEINTQNEMLRAKNINRETMLLVKKTCNNVY